MMKTAIRAKTDTIGQMKRAVRKAERRSGDGNEIGGTGQTVIKQRFSPLAWLISQQRIGREELQAAEEVLRVFMAISGGLLARSSALLNAGGSSGASARNVGIDGNARYQAWAQFWSKRAKRGDPTLAIVIAGVVDEQPLRAIENDRSLRHGRAAETIVSGLRDYAARAGWVDRNTARTWSTSAEKLFKLRKAVNRVACERGQNQPSMP